MCAEIKPDGTDGEEELIAKRLIYTNNLYGIPIEGNMISVGVDENGVYDIIDTWKDVKPDSASTYGRSQALEYTDAVTAIIFIVTSSPFIRASIYIVSSVLYRKCGLI